MQLLALEPWGQGRHAYKLIAWPNLKCLPCAPPPAQVKLLHPPGTEIYRNGNISMFEVRGCAAGCLEGSGQGLQEEVQPCVCCTFPTLPRPSRSS